jgi:pullulanase
MTKLENIENFSLSKIFRFASLGHLLLFDRVYNRGGYVWLYDGEDAGLLFLEEDWLGDRLPDDLLEEAGLLCANLELVEPLERARIGGYAKIGNWVRFYLPDNGQPLEPAERVFLVGDLNQWNGQASPVNFELKQVEAGYAIDVAWDDLMEHAPFEFKFLSDQGKWFGPKDFLPCPINSAYEGARNFLFDPKRSGRDIFQFKIARPRMGDEVKSWKSAIPQGRFGYHVDAKGGKIRLFAPRAQAVELLIYEKDGESENFRHPMHRSEDGSWSVGLGYNLDGAHYRFRVTHLDHRNQPYSRVITDPYARALAGRNGPGIVISEPVPKKHLHQPPPMRDVILVEAHLRDLLAKADFEISEEERLSFSGLTKWLKSGDCYLQKLGANVVELQPVQEFDARTKEEYHWGYMPVNFFSPASVYASRNKDGSVVEEFADLIDAFHQANLSVVIDVVYNHVGIPPHLIFLDREIYFLTNENGDLSNHSGCGNDLDCDSKPVRKLVLDSLIYFVERFDVDGFRFDLGELLGAAFLDEIENELKKYKPGILLFAEPWSFRGRLPASMNQTGFGLWSDECREGLLSYAKGQSDQRAVHDLLLGRLDGDNLEFVQSVNYLESHDDYALLDRFRDLLGWELDDAPPKEICQRYLLAMGLLLVSPGVPMLPAGADFLRHKSGVRNTYLRGDLNVLDYAQINIRSKEVEFVRKMIQLRLSTSGSYFRRSKKDDWPAEVFFGEDGQSIGITWESLEGEANYLVQVNPMTAPSSLHLLPAGWDKGGVQTLVSSAQGNDIPGIVTPLSFSWFARTGSHSEKSGQ